MGRGPGASGQWPCIWRRGQSRRGITTGRSGPWPRPAPHRGRRRPRRPRKGWGPCQAPLRSDVESARSRPSRSSSWLASSAVWIRSSCGLRRRSWRAGAGGIRRRTAQVWSSRKMASSNAARRRRVREMIEWLPEPTPRPRSWANWATSRSKPSGFWSSSCRQTAPGERRRRACRGQPDQLAVGVVRGEPEPVDDGIGPTHDSELGGDGGTGRCPCQVVHGEPPLGESPGAVLGVGGPLSGPGARVKSRLRGGRSEVEAGGPGAPAPGKDEAPPRRGDRPRLQRGCAVGT